MRSALSLVAWSTQKGRRVFQIALTSGFASEIGIGAAATRRPPSRPEELRPEPLTEPDVNLSTHPARATPENVNAIAASGFEAGGASRFISPAGGGFAHGHVVASPTGR